MKQIPFAVALALAAPVIQGHQGPPQQPPAQQQPQPQAPQPPATFRSSVDVVPVDVSIIDREGRPVDNLTPGDFVLTIDGRPRKIASAEFIKVSRDAAPPPSSPYYSSNAAATGGRLVMIVIDQGNIGAGRGRHAADAAARFVSRLNPSDRVGLFTIPGAGPQIDFTANHAIVKTMLQKIVGQASTFGPSRVGISEATKIDRGDEITLRGLFERECPGRSGADLESCRQELTAEARDVYNQVRDRTTNSITSLRYILQRLAETSSPKTVIFVSEGLVVDREFADVSWIAATAARGQVSLYVLQLDTPEFDASQARPSPTRNDDKHLAQEGLGLMAGMARGTVFHVVSGADFAFNRLALELSGYYLVGFEPESGDRDGKTHRIKVEVPGRRGIEVRSRSEFNIDPPRSRTDEELVAETLRAPLLTSDLGLKVTTFTFRDAESQKLRIIIAADIDRSPNPAGRLSLGYMLADARGRIIASQYEPEVKARVDPLTRVQHFIGTANADQPGVYIAKIAVIDDKGKRGSVEHSFRAQLSTAGQMRLTDLLIVENAGTPGLAPAVDARFTTDTLHGYMELYSDAPEALKKANVTLEVSDREDGRALDSSPLRFTESSTASRVVAEGSVTIALLPPGDYVARAVVSIGGQKAGQVSRPFTIARAAATVTAPGAGMSGMIRRPAIPFASRIDGFDPKAVLAPPVVGFFLDRMNVENRAAPAAVVEHARAGRFNEALEALNASGSDNALARAFLNGLALYERGALDAAADQFRAAIKANAEFFPAVFYLGSCYAAGGKDRDAAAAWQTSLVTESDAPFIYTLLGDALLRIRQNDQAVDILQEAVALWPDNDDVLLRYGTALSMAGDPAEALKVLDPYLAKHPEDHERHFVALRTIYEAHVAGKTVGTKEEDRARFDKYAAAYAAAKGPQQPIVDQWKRFMNRK